MTLESYDTRLITTYNQINAAVTLITDVNCRPHPTPAPQSITSNGPRYLVIEFKRVVIQIVLVLASLVVLGHASGVAGCEGAISLCDRATVPPDCVSSLGG